MAHGFRSRSRIIRTWNSRSREHLQSPDSLKTLGRNQLQRLLVQKPRVEPDGVTIGNTKFFIMILRTDPSIDPKMVIKIPNGGNADRMPRMPYKAPGPPPDSLNRFK